MGKCQPRLRGQHNAELLATVVQQSLERIDIIRYLAAQQQNIVSFVRSMRLGKHQNRPVVSFRLRINQLLSTEPVSRVQHNSVEHPCTKISGLLSFKSTVSMADA